MNDRVLLPVMALLAAGMGSCSTEMDPLYPAPPVPVVYSIIDLAEDSHFVRLSRSFTMRGDAVADNIPQDSLVFPGARVTLEIWSGGYLGKRAVMTPSDVERDTGIFPQKPNPVFRLDRTYANQLFFGGVGPDDLFKVIIDIPGQPVVYAEVCPLNSTEIVIPRREGEKEELFDTTNVFNISWKFKMDAYYKEMYLEVHFTDIYADRTVPRVIRWREFHSKPPPDIRNPDTGIPIPGMQFMERIASNIRDDSLVIFRTFQKAVAIVYQTDQHVYDYNVAFGVVQENQAGTSYSNIVNGYGLFGSTSQASRGFLLSYRTMDSLVSGSKTRHLRFKSW